MRGDLPDVNLLLALAWPNHQFHGPARRWFGDHSGTWITCPLTQLGFVRLSSNPAFTPHAKTPLEATLLLAAMTAHPDHRFLADSEAVASQVFQHLANRLQGHKQVTDAYLVALAMSCRARLVTFDRRIEAICPVAGTVLVLEA